METTHPTGVVFSDDPARLDFASVHAYLTRSYWSAGISRPLVERAAHGSMPFGLYELADSEEAQIGYARLVTDRATFAYVCDVFVLASHQGRGLGTWFTRQILDHPELGGLRRWLLTTQDAHAVYERVGFERAPFPERFMVIDRPTLYTSAEGRQPDAAPLDA